MNIFNRLFHNRKVECPRCRGKKQMEEEDVKRLKKELYWAPGNCAYCNGKGVVTPGRTEKVAVDCEYLVSDLPFWERLMLVNGYPGARKRAGFYKSYMDGLIEQIYHAHRLENKSAEEIAEYLLSDPQHKQHLTPEKQELIKYIQKVIDHKRSGE